MSSRAQHKKPRGSKSTIKFPFSPGDSERMNMDRHRLDIFIALNISSSILASWRGSQSWRKESSLSLAPLHRWKKWGIEIKKLAQDNTAHKSRASTLQAPCHSTCSPKSFWHCLCQWERYHFAGILSVVKNRDSSRLLVHIRPESSETGAASPRSRDQWEAALAQASYYPGCLPQGSPQCPFHS